MSWRFQNKNKTMQWNWYQKQLWQQCSLGKRHSNNSNNSLCTPIAARFCIRAFEQNSWGGTVHNTNRFSFATTIWLSKNPTRSLLWVKVLSCLGVNGADGPPSQPLWRSKGIQISYLSLFGFPPHTKGLRCWIISCYAGKILIFRFYTNPSLVFPSFSNMEVGPCTVESLSKFGWVVWTVLNDTFWHIAKVARCFRVLVQYCNTAWIDWMLDIANISLKTSMQIQHFCMAILCIMYLSIFKLYCIPFHILSNGLRAFYNTKFHQDPSGANFMQTWTHSKAVIWKIATPCTGWCLLANVEPLIHWVWHAILSTLPETSLVPSHF